MDITKYDADIQKAINNFIELADAKKESIKHELTQLNSELELIHDELSK